ncbi:DNA repair protein RadC [candidate division KSB1 bacterium]|nr:DNA repair protein RadC [candidate division KSB1 bacterium]
MARYASKITDWPEDDRPRERLIRLGADKLSDVEILAILLRTGGVEDTAIDLARYALKKFKGWRGLDQCTIPELCEINGVGPAKAAMLKAALEIGKRLFIEKSGVTQRITSSEDVYHLMKPHLRDSAREVFRILLLNSRNHLILDKTVFEGSLTESLVSPREIVKDAVNNSAASVIFVHNHPSGDPKPSNEDKQVTARLRMACDLVGIKVVDHLIIGKDSYFSFSDSGLL